MKPLVIVYLASPRDWRHLQWSRINCLRASLELVAKHMPSCIPVIVFHEDYTEEDKIWLRMVNPRVTFERVDFAGHENEFASTRPGERVGSYGYAMMCRFWAGWVQRHPALQEYSHYMRLDDDSYIIRHVSEEAINRMLLEDYTYRDNYTDKNGARITAETARYLADMGLPCNVKYKDGLPYNNFHVSSLRLWDNLLVSEYTKRMECGILRYGFHDTHVHSMIIRYLCPIIGASVHIEKEFAYRHNQQCCHEGDHNEFCYDGTAEPLQWGPPKF